MEGDSRTSDGALSMTICVNVIAPTLQNMRAAPTIVGTVSEAPKQITCRAYPTTIRVAVSTVALIAAGHHWDATVNVISLPRPIEAERAIQPRDSQGLANSC